MKVWIDAAGFDPAIRIFGLDLIERHLRALGRLMAVNALPTETCIDFGTNPAAVPRIRPELAQRLNLIARRETGDAGERLARFLEKAGDSPVLILSADMLADGRLYPDFAKRAGSWLVRGTDKDAAAVMMRIDTKDRHLLPMTGRSVADLATHARTAGIRPLMQADFNGFVRNLRKTMPFYVFAVTRAADIPKLQKFLFWSNYKGSTDFFTRYVYPPLVWLLVRPLARLRVHPNLVTIVGIILTFAAVPLFAQGAFLAGLLMSYGMSVLDSVDGKLARLTFTDSFIGNILDHGLDLIHPPIWYIAWAIGLGAQSWDHPLAAVAVVSTVVYILDRVVLKIYPKIFQRGFHTHSKMDGFVRTFISRRNINLPIFTLGVAADAAMGGGHNIATMTFYVIVFWQVATLIYHASRTFWIIAVQKAHRDPTRASAA